MQQRFQYRRKAGSEGAGVPGSAAAAGIETDDMEVIRIVVFTDNRISVRNCYKGAKTCFSQPVITYIIDGYEGQGGVCYRGRTGRNGGHN